MAKKTKAQTVTVRKNGVTRKLHGAAAAAVLRAREARAKKRQKGNGVGSTIKTVVKAIHEGARGVAKATIANGKARTWCVDAYRGARVAHQSETEAANKAEAIKKTRDAYKAAGLDPRQYRFVARPAKANGRTRRNADHRDAEHPIEVSRHFRAGGKGYKTRRQRATEAGQKWLFENPAHLRLRARRKRNPEGGAPEMIETLYQDFQGRPTEGFELYEAPPWTPGNVAVLGGLNRLRLAGGEKVDFDPEHVVLGADRDGELLILGAQFGGEVVMPGDGEGSFEAIETPAYMPDEIVLIDEIKKIEYDTHKDHIGDGDEYRFVHKFGEEGGERPFLALDGDGFPMIVGGDYFITREGIRD